MVKIFSLSVFLIGSRVYNYRLYYLLIVCFSVNAVFFPLFSVLLRCEREIQWENTFLGHWRASRYIPHMLIPNFPEAPPGSFSAVNLVLLEGLYQIKKLLIHITSKLKQNSQKSGKWLERKIAAVLSLQRFSQDFARHFLSLSWNLLL